jgi:hypothetical protein
MDWASQTIEYHLSMGGRLELSLQIVGLKKAIVVKSMTLTVRTREYGDDDARFVCSIKSGEERLKIDALNKCEEVAI